MSTIEADTLAALETIHSSDRMEPYIAAAGSLSGAFDLYVWNAVVASQFYGTLQAVEIGLRNSCHRELTAFWGRDWFRDDDFWQYDQTFVDSFETVKQKLLNERRPITPPSVISSYPLGFWTRLFDGELASMLWEPVLQKVFSGPAPPMVTQVFRDLDELRHFRNRVMHFEPIHRRALVSDVARIERIAGWIDPVLADWVRRCDGVSVILDERRATA
jgi:hypothetical protein